MTERKTLEALAALDIKIHRARYTVLDPRWSFEGAQSSYSRIYFVKEGKGILKSENSTVDICGGNMYFIPFGLKFSYSCEYLEKIFFHINLPVAEGYDFFSDATEIAVLPFSGDNFESLRRLLDSESYLDMLEIRSLVISSVISFASYYKLNDVKVKTYSTLVSSAISYIENNVRINLSVSDIARELFVSESKLRNKFVAEMGIPIGKYIDDIVFMRARLLLSDKGMSISSVSSELCFCDRFYFSRRFKSRFGITPAVFKKINEI